MALAVVYDPRHHTWESWTCLMCEAYAGQQLQMHSLETNWKSWAEGLKSIDVFSNEAIPGPSAFASWQEWAQQLVNTVNQDIA